MLRVESAVTSQSQTKGDIPLVERVVAERSEPLRQVPEQIVEVSLVPALVEGAAAIKQLIPLAVALGLQYEAGLEENLRRDA